MKNSSLIKFPIGGLLCLAVACGESHVLEPDDFDELGEPALSDSGVAGPSTRLDAGAGGLLGGLLEPGALDDLLNGLAGGAGGGQPALDAGARDAGSALPARDGGAQNAACERFPQLPFCPRDAGATDASLDASTDAGPNDAGQTDAAQSDAGDAGSSDAALNEAGLADASVSDAAADAAP